MVLLAPQRPGHAGGGRQHDGTIIEVLPNRMWGTDGKQFYTQQDGWSWLFSVIDHYNDEILGWHVAKIGNRFAAIEPLRQAVRKVFGTINQHVCENTGLFLRLDHGSQYTSKDFQNELAFLDLSYSPAFVRSPQCNGVIERFHRTINEQVFDINIFETLQDAKKEIGTFISNYNNDWLIHRLGLKSPIEFRKDFDKKIALKIA